MKKVIYTIFTVVILAAIITFVTSGGFIREVYDSIMTMVKDLFNI